ncbi:hypothetical protein ACIQUD_14725 [Streptomyces globisporus]|uniref:hypothetical protein n=1 Tax=Streptomyces globisporus TaxID=1908 RepID=UPI0038144DA4
MSEELDPLADPIMLDLIGFVTGIVEMRKIDGPSEDEALLDAVGTLASQLMPPSFTISGTMTSEQLGQEISKKLSGHLLRLTACFGYLFTELAAVNDDDAVHVSTASLLRQMSLEIKQRSGDA